MRNLSWCELWIIGKMWLPDRGRFSLYINDLSQSCRGAAVQMYAEDTAIYVSGRTTQSVSTQLFSYLQSIAA